MSNTTRRNTDHMLYLFSQRVDRYIQTKQKKKEQNKNKNKKRKKKEM